MTVHADHGARRDVGLWPGDPAEPIVEVLGPTPTGHVSCAACRATDAASEGRRSVRTFSSGPVPQGVVREAIEAAVHHARGVLPGTAPVCVVTDREREPELWGQFCALYVEAPVFVVLGLPPETYSGLAPGEYERHLVRAGAYAQWIWMELRRRGLECCPFGELAASEGRVRRALGVRQVLTLAVGYEGGS